MNKYGKCLVTEYNDFRNFLKKYKDTDKALYEYAKASAKITGNTPEAVAASNRFDLLYCDVKGILLHLYFLDKELKDLLLNMDLPNPKNVIDFINDQSYDSLYPVLNETDNKHIQFCVHVPDEEKGYVFRIAFDKSNNDLIFFIIDNSENGFHAFLKQGLESEIGWLIKLAINTLFYINCFSECLVTGIPKGVRLDSSYSCPKYKVNISEKLKSKTDTGESHLIASHFRRGHFRYFPIDSEYFVNKKGTSTWIEATTVKGNNKIVLTDEKFKDEIYNERRAL